MGKRIGYFYRLQDFDIRDDFETQISKGIAHNNEIRFWYLDRIEECEEQIQRFAPKVFCYTNSPQQNELLIRQLTQVKAAYTTLINSEIDLGCTIDGEENGITEAFNSMVFALRKKLETIDSYLTVVEQNLKKNALKGSASLEDNIFSFTLLGELYDKFNDNLFSNTLNDFIEAVNNPSSNIKLNIKHGWKSRAYYFINELHLKAKREGYDELFCKKQGYDFEIFKKKRTSLNDSKVDMDFKKKLYECLKKKPN